MTTYTDSLERSLTICAERTTVFRFFTDSQRFASWWGPGSSIDPTPGGKVTICYPGGVLALGKVLEIAPPEKIVFSYGYESGSPIPPESSRVSITLSEHKEGTVVQLRHEFTDPAIRDLHIDGWRYQLALFANVTCKDQHAGFAELLDEYFHVWELNDFNARMEILNRIADSDITFRDAYGSIIGREELSRHIGAAQRFMANIRLQREGEPVQCQGTAMARWSARKPDGNETARGTSMFHFTPHGRIASITGFWTT